MHISEIKWRSEIQWLTVCEHAWKRERERERDGQEEGRLRSMVSNVSVIRSDAEVHYETPLRLYI